jgi:hypothetical protein
MCRGTLKLTKYLIVPDFRTDQKTTGAEAGANDIQTMTSAPERFRPSIAAVVLTTGYTLISGDLP